MRALPRVFLPVLLCCVFFQGAFFLGAFSQAEAAQSSRSISPGAARLEALRKAYVPPPAGVMPKPDEIPMSNVQEDPDWDTPLMQSIYKNPYSYANNADLYLLCLNEARQGNPKAMLALAMLYFSWGYLIQEQYPNFPPEMHTQDFWIAQAARLTDPGWVELRLGDLSLRWPKTAARHYLRAAELGNAEGMYRSYVLSSGPEELLYRSAALGSPQAAFALAESLNKSREPQERELARRYVWLSALNADEWGLLHASISFYNGEMTGARQCEKGYLYATLAERCKPANAEGKGPVRPENVCRLPESVVLKLEAEADAWLAALEARRRPHLEAARQRRLAAADELRAELATLTAMLEAPDEVDEPDSEPAFTAQDKPDAQDFSVPRRALSQAPEWGRRLGFYAVASVAARPSDVGLPQNGAAPSNGREPPGVEKDEPSSVATDVSFLAAAASLLGLGMVFFYFRRKRRGGRRAARPVAARGRAGAGFRAARTGK